MRVTKAPAVTRGYTLDPATKKIVVRVPRDLSWPEGDAFSIHVRAGERLLIGAAIPGGTLKDEDDGDLAYSWLTAGPIPPGVTAIEIEIANPRGLLLGDIELIELALGDAPLDPQRVIDGRTR